MDLSYKSFQSGNEVLKYLLENDISGDSVSLANISVNNLRQPSVSTTMSKDYRSCAPVTVASTISSHSQTSTTNSNDTRRSVSLQHHGNVRIPPPHCNPSFPYLKEIYVSMLVQNPSYGIPFEDFCRKFFQGNLKQLVPESQQQQSDTRRYSNVARNLNARSSDFQVPVSGALNLSTSQQQTMQSNVPNSHNAQFPTIAPDQTSDRQLMGEWYQSHSQKTHNLTDVPPQFPPSHTTSTASSGITTLISPPCMPNVRHNRVSAVSPEATPQDSSIRVFGVTRDPSSSDDHLQIDSFSDRDNIMMYRLHNGKRYRVSADNLNMEIASTADDESVGTQPQWPSGFIDLHQAAVIDNSRGRGNRTSRGASGQGKDSGESIKSSGAIRPRGRPRKNIFETMNDFRSEDSCEDSISDCISSKEQRKKKGLVKFNFKSKKSKNLETDVDVEKQKSLTFSQNERIAIGERVKKLLYMSRLNCIKKEKTEESASDSNEKHKESIQTEERDETLPKLIYNNKRKRKSSEPQTQQSELDVPSDSVDQPSLNSLGDPSKTVDASVGTNMLPYHVLSCTNLQTGETTFSSISQPPTPGDEDYDSDATIPYMEEDDCDTSTHHQEGEGDRTTEVIIKQESCRNGESVVQVSCVPDQALESSTQAAIGKSVDTNQNLLSGGVRKVTNKFYRFLEIEGIRYIPFQDLNTIFDAEDIKQCLKERNNDVKGKFSAYRCTDVEVDFFSKLESNLPTLKQDCLLLEEELLLDLKKRCKSILALADNENEQEDETPKRINPVVDKLCAPAIKPLPIEIATDMRNDDTSCYERDDDKDTVSVDEDEVMTMEEDEDDILPLELSLNENEDCEEEEGESKMEFDIKAEVNEDFESQNCLAVPEVHQVTSDITTPLMSSPSCSANNEGKENRISELIMSALMDYEEDTDMDRQISLLSCQCKQSCQESHLMMTKAFLAIWKQNCLLKEQVADLRSDVEKLKDEQSTTHRLHKAVI